MEYIEKTLQSREALKRGFEKRLWQKGGLLNTKWGFLLMNLEKSKYCSKMRNEG